MDEFPHPYVAVDVILLTVRDEHLETLVIERTDEPLGWALPGAFVDPGEDVADTAKRVLHDKLGVRRRPHLLALPPFGAVKRDPRRRVVSLPFVALVDPERFHRRVPTGPQAVEVATVTAAPLAVTVRGRKTKLAFDHMKILKAAAAELGRRVQLGDDTVLAELLPERFTVRDLQRVHEALLGRSVNKDSFRRQVAPRLEDTGQREEGVDHRPAALYRWSARPDPTRRH